MKKCFIIAICLCSVLAFARGPHRGHHYHRHHRGNDGVWLAAGITSIVANGINILNTVIVPRHVAPAPVATPTPVVPQIIYPQTASTTQIAYSQPVGVPTYRYDKPKVPIVQTVLVPIQINGQTVYRLEQRVIYMKLGK